MDWTDAVATDAIATGVITRASIVLLLAAVATALMRRCKAATRHEVWTIGLVAALVLPVLVLVMPAWALPWPVADSASTYVYQSGSDQPFTTWALAALAWGLGALATMAWHAAGAGAATRFARRARPIDAERVRDAMAECTTRLGYGRTVSVAEHDDTKVPVVWGVFHPTVVLPTPWRAWPEDLLRSVLLHEVAHVARLDLLTRTIGSLATAAYWFHPMVWIADFRMRLEAEQACDALAARHAGGAERYAAHLVEVARRAPRRTAQCGAPAMARRAGLRARLAALLDGAPRRRGPRLGVTLAAASFVVVAAATASVEPRRGETNAELSVVRATAVRTAGETGRSETRPAGWVRAVPDSVVRVVGRDRPAARSTLVRRPSQ